MSARSIASWQNISAARHMLQELARGLRAHRDVIARTASRVGDQVQAVESAFLGRHVYSGNALDTQHVTIAGGLVVSHRERYLQYVPGNPMREDKLPPFVVKRATELLAAEFLAVIGHGEGAIGAIATKLVEGVAERAAKKARRKTDAAARRAARRAGHG